jgi:hypothetical protein
MAGRGPAPKDPRRRARSNTDPIPTTVLRFESAEAPELPADLEADPHVAAWWDTWRASPQAEHFGSTDWAFLLETAYLVAAFYGGDLKLAAEIRLRVAKYGATPEDRARLRMTFAQADEADAKRPEAPSARERYANLRVVRPEAAGEG